MLIALHRALLHSVQSERDPLVLAATLRALGTLLLGAPYHRLPPQLLPLCVQALLGCLANATPAPPAGPAGLVPEQLPVVSACLSCLAAAFSSKAAGASLVQELTPAGGSSDTGGEQQQLLQLLFSYAACQHVALQLEAMMALRGVAQQHAAQLDAHWERLLAIARVGAGLNTGPQPPRPQGGEECARTCCTCHVACTSNADLHLCVTSAAELLLLVLVVVRNRSGCSSCLLLSQLMARCRRRLRSRACGLLETTWKPVQQQRPNWMRPPRSLWPLKQTNGSRWRRRCCSLPPGMPARCCGQRLRPSLERPRLLSLPACQQRCSSSCWLGAAARLRQTTPRLCGQPQQRLLERWRVHQRSARCRKVGRRRVPNGLPVGSMQACFLQAACWAVTPVPSFQLLQALTSSWLR